MHKYFHNNQFRAQYTVSHNLTNPLTGMSTLLTINTITLRSTRQSVCNSPASCLTGHVQRFSLATHNKHNVRLPAMVIIMFTVGLAEITHLVQNVKHIIQHSRISKFKHNRQTHRPSHAMTMITFHISESFLSIKPIVMLLVLPYCLASSVEPTDCQHSAASLLFSPSVHKRVQ